jgi:hypothetical protein
MGKNNNEGEFINLKLKKYKKLVKFKEKYHRVCDEYDDLELQYNNLVEDYNELEDKYDRLLRRTARRERITKIFNEWFGEKK